MRVISPLVVFFICQCFVGGLGTPARQLTQATSKPAIFNPPLFTCSYYYNRACNPGDFLCANLTPFSSCACNLGPPYKIVNSNSAGLQCQKSLRLTPGWLLFFAGIGFTFISTVLLFVGWRLWPLAKLRATDAYYSVRNFVLRQNTTPASRPFQLSSLYAAYENENYDAAGKNSHATSSRL